MRIKFRFAKVTYPESFYSETTHHKDSFELLLEFCPCLHWQMEAKEKVNRKFTFVSSVLILDVLFSFRWCESSGIIFPSERHFCICIWLAFIEC